LHETPWEGPTVPLLLLQARINNHAARSQIVGA
jgi:hypothetical protein